jgi:type III restriction enzyme
VKSREYAEDEADRVAKGWLTHYRIAIKNLTDDRQEAYRDLKSWSREPVDIDLVKPTTWMEPTTIKENDEEKELPFFDKHLMCDAAGKFPALLNPSETKVVEIESGRGDNVGWYRNPSKGSQDSLGVSYEMDDKHSIVRPDFLFFSKKADGSIVVDMSIHTVTT